MNAVILETRVSHDLLEKFREMVETAGSHATLAIGPLSRIGPGDRRASIPTDAQWIAQAMSATTCLLALDNMSENGRIVRHGSDDSQNAMTNRVSQPKHHLPQIRRRSLR